MNINRTKDHLGSVRVTVTEDGSVLGWDDYYPFGLQLPGRSSNTANMYDDQKFTGHFLDQEGGLGIYHAVARMYDPAIGRFWGVDAMRSEMPGWNTYHYTFNNPVRFVDPDGNHPDEHHSAVYNEDSKTHTVSTVTSNIVSETTNKDGTITLQYRHTTTTTTVQKSTEDGQVTKSETTMTTVDITATYGKPEQITESGGFNSTQSALLSREVTGVSTSVSEGSAGHQNTVDKVFKHQKKSSGPFTTDQIMSQGTSLVVGGALLTAGVLTVKFGGAGAPLIGNGLNTLGAASLGVGIIDYGRANPGNKLYLGRTRK